MDVNRDIVVLLVLLVLPTVTISEDVDLMKDSSKILSRRRRYVTFPEGASFSMAACLTVGVLGNPMPGIFTWGLNWGIAFELPNETMSFNALKRAHYIPRPVIARRYRRDLYSKLEIVISDMGYDGRECIFRALCEAAQRLLPKGNSILEELFRTLFTYPLTRVHPSEPVEHYLYEDAHKNGLSDMDCQHKYRKCPVSLLDLALGYYTPSSSVNNYFS